MAIDLNVNKYGAQFSAFVDFANKATDENTVVCVADDRNKTQAENRREFEDRLLGIDGTPRCISAKTDGDAKWKFWRGRDIKDVNKDVRGLFQRTVLAVCGVRRMEDLPPAVLDVMKKDDFEADGRPLTVRRIRAVTNAILANAGASADQTTAAAFVSGNNAEMVAKLQNRIANASGLPATATPEEKAAAFAARMSKIAADEVSIAFAKVAGKCLVDRTKVVDVEDFEQTHYQFNRDLDGAMRVNISGIGQLSRDYGEERDQLTRFVMGDENATFAGAAMQVKRQVGILMSIMTQFTANVVERAFNVAIDVKQVATSPLGNSGSQFDKPMEYSLSKTADGDVLITFGQSNGLAALMMTENGETTENMKMHMLNPDTSNYVVGLEIKLPASRLEELANADWTQFDVETFEVEGNKGNGEGQFELLPEAYRLNAEVSASIHYELNA